MTEINLEQSLAGGEHKKLQQLVGKWQGVTKTWFEGDEPSDQSPVTGTIEPLLGGRFVMHRYQGSFSGKPLEGVAIFGYNLKAKKFQAAWIDSFHMGEGIMFSEGIQNGVFYSATGSYQSWEEKPQTWGWRTEIEIINNNQIVISAYNISPEGSESLATRTDYQRIGNHQG